MDEGAVVVSVAAGFLVSGGVEEPKMSSSELSTAGFVAVSEWADIVMAGEKVVEWTELESVRVEVMD